MDKKDNLDLVALEAAKQHMGSFAWPTVVLGIVLLATHLATPVLVVMDVMPLLIAVPLMALVTYASYTVLHDAAHGSISGNEGGSTRPFAIKITLGRSRSNHYDVMRFAQHVPNSTEGVLTRFVRPMCNTERF